MRKQIGVFLLVLGVIGIVYKNSLTGAVIGNSALFNWLNLIFILCFLTGSVMLLTSKKLEERIPSGTFDDLDLAEALRNAKQGVPKGEFHAGIPGIRYRNYSFDAYAGGEIVMTGRREHQIDGRCHVTIYSPDLRKPLRVDVDTLQEVDNQKVPKDLRKYIQSHQKEIRRQVYSFYKTGRWAG